LIALASPAPSDAAWILVADCEGGIGNQPMYFDNIYTSPGPNLSNPTPEPTRALLLALASLPLFLTRRRPIR
jgi:hypothetical protein